MIHVLMNTQRLHLLGYLQTTSARYGREQVRVAIVGSSFIGMEAAACLIKTKTVSDVTVIGMEQVCTRLLHGDAHLDLLGRGVFVDGWLAGWLADCGLIVAALTPTGATRACAGRRGGSIHAAAA